MVSNRGNGGYRSVVFTLAGLAIVAVGLYLLIKDLSTVDSAYRHAASDASVKYESDAQAYIKESCLSPTGLRENDCSAKAKEAAREGQRKEQDLAAQNVTAWWTKVMGVAALIGMALSAVGVWLVKTTFDETRKANQISAKHQRAWLVVQLKAVDHEMGYGHSIGLTVENVGSSVATNAVVRFGVWTEAPNTPFGGELVSLRHTVRTGDTTPVAVSLPSEGVLDGSYFAGVVSYDTVFGGPYHSYFCLKVVRVPERIGISGPSRAGISEVPINWPADT